VTRVGSQRHEKKKTLLQHLCQYMLNYMDNFSFVRLCLLSVSDYIVYYDWCSFLNDFILCVYCVVTHFLVVPHVCYLTLH